MNARRLIIWLVLALSVAGWSFTVFQTLALSTGRLGAMTVRWTRFDQAKPSLMTWSSFKSAAFTASSVTKYIHRAVIVQPGGSVSFILNTPTVFQSGDIRIQGDPGLDINVGDLSSRPRPTLGGEIYPTNQATTRHVAWNELTKTSGGYQFTIINSAATPAELRAINVTFHP